MNQEQIEAMQRLEKMDLIAKKCEHFISLLEEKLGATPESSASLEKKVAEIDSNCSKGITELAEACEGRFVEFSNRLMAIERVVFKPEPQEDKATEPAVTE